MDRLVEAFLELLNTLTLGALGRSGAGDAEAVARDEAERRATVRAELDAWIGRVGVTSTPLRPAGKVVVDGRTLDAATEGGFLARGRPVVVVGGRAGILIVRARHDNAAR